MATEAAIFAVSMSNSMGFVFPEPIETDQRDEVPAKIRKKDSGEFRHFGRESSTRWFHVANLMRKLINTIPGQNFDFTLIKYSSTDTTTITGKNDKTRDLLMANLRELSSEYKSFGPTTSSSFENLVNEIQKVKKTKKPKTLFELHWFIDAEGFSQMNPQFLSSVQIEKVQLYVIGSITELHSHRENVKYCCKWFEGKQFSNIHLILSERCIEELRQSVDARIPKIRTETSSTFRFSDRDIPIKLHGYKNWKPLKINLLGVLSDFDLGKKGFYDIQLRESEVFALEHDTKNENRRLLATKNEAFLLNFAQCLVSSKPSLNGFCECYMKNRTIEHCLIVFDASIDDGELGLKIVRLTENTKEIWKCFLKMDAIHDGNESQEPVKNRYRHTAMKEIKKKLMETEKESKTREELESAFDMLIKEYKAVGMIEKFVRDSKGWADGHGLKFEHDNNNNNN